MIRPDTPPEAVRAVCRRIVVAQSRGSVAPYAPLAWGDHPGPAAAFLWLAHFIWYRGVRRFREVISAGAAVIS